MTEILFNWLEERFRLDNHKKYHKYFDEWVSNLTSNQITYFEKQRLSLINKSMIAH